VAVIVGNTPSALAAKAATKTVPIVFATGGNPVREGLVASLNRPGGNVTGVSFISVELGAKRLGLLRELRPGAARIAVFVDPKFPTTERFILEVRDAASAMGSPLRWQRPIDSAFTTLVQRGAGALLCGSGGLLYSRRDLIVALAARHRTPAIYDQRDYVAAGGLMSHQPALLSHDFLRFYAPNPRLGRAKSGWRHNGRECDALARSACELVHTAGVA